MYRYKPMVLTVQHQTAPSMLQEVEPGYRIPKGWCETRLADGDTLAALAARFFPKDQGGAQKIVEANGIFWATATVNAWVMNTGGRWLPHVEGTPVVEGSATGGWAVFTSASQIMLPCKPAKPGPGGTTPGGKKCECPADKTPWWLALAGFGVGAVGTALLTGDDKKKKKKGKS